MRATWVEKAGQSNYVVGSTPSIKQATTSTGQHAPQTVFRTGDSLVRDFCLGL
jgi:hypothetical protein